MQVVLGDGEPWEGFAGPLWDLTEVLLQVVVYGKPAELPSLKPDDNHVFLHVLDHTLWGQKCLWKCLPQPGPRFTWDLVV